MICLKKLAKNAPLKKNKIPVVKTRKNHQTYKLMIRYMLATIFLLVFLRLFFETSKSVYLQRLAEFSQGYRMLRRWSLSSLKMKSDALLIDFSLILRKQLLPLVFLIFFCRRYPISFSLIWKAHWVKTCEREVMGRREYHICNLFQQLRKWVVLYVPPLHLP